MLLGVMASAIADNYERNSMDKKPLVNGDVSASVPRESNSFASKSRVSASIIRTDERAKTQNSPNPSIASSEHFKRLNILKDLFDQGYITVAEYNERKSQIVDEITGTSSTNSRSKRSSRNKLNKMVATVPYRPPPDFSKIPEETAIKHQFDPKTRSWTKKLIKVKIDSEPFAKGGLRYAHHLQVVEDDDSGKTVYMNTDGLPETFGVSNFVAKISIDPDEDRDAYFQDVEIQSHAKEWAAKFNSFNPPKKVDFVKAYCIEMPERPSKPVYGVERYIQGSYRKHNNNFGYVSEDERNTPQAFSHFTYHMSQHTVLVCDIQGVGDLYTDPQMHTIAEGFGKGNMGQKGFERFLQTHRCNAICRYLGLPIINAKVLDSGTRPSTTHALHPVQNKFEYQLGPTTPLLSPHQSGIESNESLSSVPVAQSPTSATCCGCNVM